MRFTYFHLMPYDGLPEDFASTNRSVWVDIDPKLMNVRRIHQLYNDYLDELEYAAECGFDAVGVNEHHNNAYGLMSSPNMMAAALARRIAHTDAKLLVMGDAVPLYNPPIRIAEELAMLDVLSGGRLVTGFPLGSSQDANFGYGMVPATLRERHREGFDLIMKAWTSDEVFTHNGRYSKLRYVNPWPRPLQKPHPPIWIPGSGSLETMDFAIERDVPYFFLSYFGSEFAKSMLDRYRDRVTAAGRDDNPYRTGMFQIILVARTDDEARRLYERHVQYFYRRALHVYPGFMEAPGYKTVKSLREVLPPPGAQAGSRPDSFGATRRYSWDDFVEQGIVIGGSPETVRQRLEANAKELNIGSWISVLHVGDMPFDLAMSNINLFTSEVLPHVQPLFAEHENRWWPAPVPGLERAMPRPLGLTTTASGPAEAAVEALR
jgi:alkanesulfonate monooxygenase SsuD/methylene tetrahydromethanopterin reductase-like flavin-dependent oxidoreductase (luciferase family)